MVSIALLYIFLNKIDYFFPFDRKIDFVMLLVELNKLAPNSTLINTGLRVR